MVYEDFKIDIELLKKVVENNGKCLCKLNTVCPCDEFLEEKKCHCGVYKKE